MRLVALAGQGESGGRALPRPTGSTSIPAGVSGSGRRHRRFPFCDGRALWLRRFDSCIRSSRPGLALEAAASVAMQASSLRRRPGTRRDGHDSNRAPPAMAGRPAPTTRPPREELGGIRHRRPARRADRRRPHPARDHGRDRPRLPARAALPPGPPRRPARPGDPRRDPAVHGDPACSTAARPR